MPITAAKMPDKPFVHPGFAQNILAMSAAYSSYMAVSSNLRYQVCPSLHMCSPWSHSLPVDMRALLQTSECIPLHCTRRVQSVMAERRLLPACTRLASRHACQSCGRSLTLLFWLLRQSDHRGRDRGARHRGHLRQERGAVLRAVLRRAHQQHLPGLAHVGGLHPPAGPAVAAGCCSRTRAGAPGWALDVLGAHCLSRLDGVRHFLPMTQLRPSWTTEQAGFCFNL